MRSSQLASILRRTRRATARHAVSRILSLMISACLPLLFMTAWLPLFFLTACLPSLTPAPDSSIFGLFSASGTDNVSNNMPTTPAILSFTPPSGVLQTTDSIRIRFNRTMDTGSCSTTGSIGTATATWSTTQYANDTVTFTGAWVTGMERYFEVSGCATPDSQTVGSQYRIWSVFNPGTLRYVRQGASALNDGLTASTPIPDLQTAIDDLAGCAGACAVLIHEGTYTSSSAIQMKEKVSLFGSYESGFTARRTKDYDSIVERSGCVDPCITLVADNTVSSATIVEGLRVQGGAGSPTSIAFDVSGCPTIQMNHIRGGGGFTQSIGLRLNGTCATSVELNIIRGGDSPDTATALLAGDTPMTVNGNYIYGGTDPAAIGTGIALSGTTTNKLIVNNMVYGGPVLKSVGMNLVGAGTLLKIYHNTIIAGNASTTTSIGVHVDSQLEVFSNHIEASGTNSFCVYEAEYLPASSLKLERNNLWNCTVLLFDYDTASDLTSLAALTGAGYTLNYRLAPAFLNPAGNDYRFTDSSPCLLTQGGHPGPLYAEDGWGSSRPGADGFTSVGAYEHDGTCVP